MSSLLTNMKKKEGRLGARVSLDRLNKLKEYAESKDKTITQIIEDWIDTLEIPSKKSLS